MDHHTMDVDNNNSNNYMMDTTPTPTTSSNPEEQPPAMQQQQQQQQQQQLSVQALESACQKILDHNFDADTKICFTTLMRMLDNLLQKPNNEKVRSINVSNPVFQSKVANRTGGIDFLQACGFTTAIFSENNPNVPLLGGGNSSNTSTTLPTTLVLKPEHEQTSHLVTARRLLMTRAIQELGCKAEELPTYKPPPPPVTVMSSEHEQPSGTDVVFNPYAGQRFDAKSAAAGTNLGPGPGYTSKTEVELQKLEQKQQQLESKLKQPPTIQWKAYRPNEKIPNITKTTTNTNTTPVLSDAQLLAQRAKKQQEERMQREHGGFTTKAMRDLERLKQQKVYSHTCLTVQFADGTKLVSSSFVPSNQLQKVKQSIQQDCLIADNHNDLDFDLYIAPPRRLLDPTKSLRDEDLVPAAKVFVSWKKGSTPPSSSNNNYIKPELFDQPQTEESVVVFPAGQSLVDEDEKDPKSKTSNKDNEDSKKPATKKANNKEEDLLRRMMGGGGGRILGGGGSGGSAASSKRSGGNGDGNTNKKPPGKPKWFK